MKYFSLIFGLSLMQLGANAQNNFSKKWILGVFGYQIEFTVTGIQQDTTFLTGITSTGFMRGHSNISDSNGAMKFISDGYNIFTPSGLLVENGDSLIPKKFMDSYSSGTPEPQNSIFLPMNNAIYYFVTPACSDSCWDNVWGSATLNKAPYDLLLYNKIDGNANNGNGKVVDRTIPLLKNKEVNKPNMMACRHGNGKDWWLLKVAGDSNMVYKFLFTQDSVYSYGKQNFPFPFRGYYDVLGQMMFTQNGDRVAFTQTDSSHEVQLADFDRCTGNLSNFQIKIIPPYTISSSVGPINDFFNMGLCFSPSRRFLYVSRFYHVIQLDLQDNSIHKVCELDTTEDQFQNYTNIYPGPDGKIYIGYFHGFSRQMSTIDNPDVEGPGCNFCRKCLRTNSYYGILTTPPCMPNYELGADTVNQNCWAVGIHNEQLIMNNEQWVVYPIPASTKLYVTSLRGGHACPDHSGKQSHYELYNSVGQLIFSTTKNEIDVSLLSKGVYYLKYEGRSKKVIIE
jgi:Secretion system C-terminal sorting domain